MNIYIFYIGIIITFIGSVLFIIKAFKESILWGLGCLLFAPVSLVFLILNWQKAKNPFFIQLLGLVIIFAGSILMPHPTI